MSSTLHRFGLGQTIFRVIPVGIAILAFTTSCGPRANEPSSSVSVPPKSSAPGTTPTPSPDTPSSEPTPSDQAGVTSSGQATPAVPAQPNTSEGSNDASLSDAGICQGAVTQPELNACSRDWYEQEDAALNQVYGNLRTQLGADQVTQLEAAEQAWLKFRDANCNLVKNQVAGGTMEPMLYYSCMAQVTAERTQELKQPSPTPNSLEAIDEELNNLYQRLKGTLSGASQEALVDAQLAWLDYRDAQCAFESTPEAECLARITENRNFQLQDQLNSWNR